MNNTPDNKEEAAFEAELFHSLKSYGYLFPENIYQVKAFENLYGNYAADTPILQNILTKDAGDPFVESIDLDMGIAAYSNQDDQFPAPPVESEPNPEIE